jgi:hypothetical protein
MSQHTLRATRRVPLLMLVAPAIALAAGFAVHLLAADGSKGKLLVYDAKVAAEQGDWYFKVELEPILFRLVSLQNKYKVIRVNIVNRSKKPLQLSLHEDRFQIRVGPSVNDVASLITLGWLHADDVTKKLKLSFGVSLDEGDRKAS